MTTLVDIRPERMSEADEIAALTEAAFGSAEEARLVEALRATEAFIAALSLVAIEDRQVIGHLLLTHARIVAACKALPALALAPMCVAPDRQRRGVGSALVREALRSAEALGHSIVIVLGHPGYYPRFGFRRASTFGVRAPFEAPDEALLMVWLGSAEPVRIDGVVEYAAPFSAVAPG